VPTFFVGRPRLGYIEFVGAPWSQSTQADGFQSKLADSQCGSLHRDCHRSAWMTGTTDHNLPLPLHKYHNEIFSIYRINMLPISTQNGATCTLPRLLNGGMFRSGPNRWIPRPLVEHPGPAHDVAGEIVRVAACSFSGATVLAKGHDLIRVSGVGGENGARFIHSHILDRPARRMCECANLLARFRFMARFTMRQHGYLLCSGGESLGSEEGGGKPLPYIGLRSSRDAPVHQRSSHTGEHFGSRRNHRRGGVYPRPFWRPGNHTAGLPE